MKGDHGLKVLQSPQHRQRQHRHMLAGKRASLITRAETTMAADMFATKSNAPNYSATPTSSVPLNPRMKTFLQ